MLLLATDTSGKHGSIALVRSEADTQHVLEMVPLQGGTFSAQLIPQIAELLSKHSMRKADIDGFVVVSGPGSFTGLRVGLAAIKALAEILRKPIAPVSLLEVIASDLHFESQQLVRDSDSLLGDIARSGNHFLIALDAGRSEVYVGEYSSRAEHAVCIGECLLTLGELADRAGNLGERIYTPDENVVKSLASRTADSGSLKIISIGRPKAVSIARLGYKKIVSGQTVSPEQLDATYIRRADAEVKNPVRTPA